MTEGLIHLTVYYILSEGCQMEWIKLAMAALLCCLYTIPAPPSHYWVGGYWRNYKQCDELSDNQDQSLSHNISHHLCTGLVSSYHLPHFIPTEGLVLFSLIPHLSSIFWHPSFHLQSLHYYHNNLVNKPSVLELAVVEPCWLAWV